MLKNAFTFKKKNIRIDINGSFSTRHQYENIHKNCKRNKTKNFKEIPLLNTILTKPDTDNVTLFFN